MNGKNIKKHLNAKMRDWLSSIDDENIKKTIKENVIITGGAIVSLLTGEEVNDYDVYFKTKEACFEVAQYYVSKWNEMHTDKPVSIKLWEKTGKVKCYVASKGIADENEEVISPIVYNFENEEAELKNQKDASKEKYRPKFITSNAITLSDKIQLVTRFYGEVEEIHKNYDFAHCTCAWSSWNNRLFLPERALECIINKELFYIGSKYPLCSIIRTRKYLDRGYHINAGQYVKMCMQLNELDLNNVEVLEDQLTGVDTAWFDRLIVEIKNHMDETGKSRIDTTYVMEVINKIF